VLAQNTTLLSAEDNGGEYQDELELELEQVGLPCPCSSVLNPHSRNVVYSTRLS
jgi:hypothetical protein